MRNLYWWTLTIVAYVIAIPALLLSFVAEKLGDYIDENEQ